jgi:hypothetical protein
MVSDVEQLSSPLNGDASLAVLSRPLIPLNFAELIKKTTIPEFNIQLTDFGTGKSSE